MYFLGVMGIDNLIEYIVWLYHQGTYRPVEYMCTVYKVNTHISRQLIYF